MAGPVIDLFSGAGGMSFGFHAHPDFEVVGAVDAQIGKPSSKRGSLGCNGTFRQNMGLRPLELDLSALSGEGLREALLPRLGRARPAVLSACPPCTGFSRANPENHLVDDPRNSLVAKVAEWAAALEPDIVVMENARELISGRFAHHFGALSQGLGEVGYRVRGEVHMLTDFGLPQRRERALVVAVREGLELRGLSDLWRGWGVRREATHVRRAIAGLPELAAGRACPTDPMHVSPRLVRGETRRRMELLPKDGGSWVDLRDHPEAEAVLTPVMKRSIAAGRIGSHPDVYGRMWWDRPAPTIKRECAHVGNGRYAHPEQDRLCTIREMALLQGFPAGYAFAGGSLSNRYRHIGDAVPPLVAYQVAAMCAWILSGRRPDLEECILPRTSLTPADLVTASVQQRLDEGRATVTSVRVKT